MTDVNTKTARWFKLIYGLLSLLMLLALLAFSYATWSNVKQQANLSLTPHNQSLTSIVKRFFVHQEALLGELAQSIVVTDNPDNIIQIRLNDVLRATPQMRVLAVVNSKGAIVATTGNIHTLEWLDLFDNDQVTIGRPFRPTFVGENILPMRKPIKNSSGVTTGYVVAAYRLLGNNAIWQEAEEAESKRRSMIIGEDGRVYISYPESDTFWQSFVSMKVEEGFLQTLAELTQKAGQWQTRDVQYQDEKLLITASLIESYHFYIVSGIQSADLFTRWFERMKFVALAVFIFLVAGLFVFRIIITRASRFESARNVAEHNVFKLSRAIEQSPSSVIVTDENWLIEYANDRLSDGTEASIKLIPGQMLLEHFPHTLLKDDVAAVSENLLHGNNWYGERRAREQKQWFSYSISAMTDDDGKISNYVIVTQDITERKQVEVRLYKQANFDALTGLPNRRRTSELLNENLKSAWQENQRVAVLYMDVDNFKQVNDTFGHILGDQMLQLVAVRLQKAVSDQGVACHMSGDEFLVSMLFDGKDDITALADNIMTVMREPVLLEGKKLFISVSIGIACYPEDSADVSSLLKHADIALYESKNRGRRCYSFFSSELDDKNKRKIELESEVRNALANNELFMVYQTKNKISSGEVYGFEALMRWESPRLGFVSPEEFISAAEEIGVIDKLGEFALYEACRDLQKFQNLVSQPLAMAVNVSMYQLTNSDIVGTVQKVINDTGINPSVLELEITESMLAQRLEEVQPVLNSLLGLGVSLSIDDFGTGYSSLSYLTRFPVSALKIDRCFITDMVDNRSDATLTHTVITMAHKLGLKVVAEGIEDEDQLALLRVYGCDLGQGYLFTKPLNYVQMTGHLKSQQEKPDWAI
ncbi:bifunctional diguanylate cyclase/phosphodiesterase [Neptunomonas qingdaonensis]|uniref:PAS domain S-box-containing protein/diguanylate cyclase (GGDEF) domain-containing protein n=1 Tax=Neptunomonas qingdaonensis TaxID=1045558 RepID=A0A1I2W0R8_9GAMM|nr:EAL domain-containing protein [Neptunomonas qingdaonensis]SFG95048.1 PAS domain S-box-containing protein/diguanylate cyclase (GGDEF) domain-containing protein [Neptunomonas qingdaonensis]